MIMEQTMFNPGDVVSLKQDVTKPKMVVKSIDKIKRDDSMKLLGITCMWFTTTHEIQEYRFYSKDLEHVEL